ncbi:hypothetical protein L249_0456 [Ophiocordyceps polyrhachis-furcata BCC 54312]|uniref:Uncharacterized protein n=1 Tax=Ophiocordyceps polyrhachis-furcata BCC 54312 TaxID=1330021 RepID=A0A367LDB4_9HYPO|nr:hypothetical protein L249_0456 [Ophiocordyceps polyrhachis-furcata BCC 54312]
MTPSASGSFFFFALVGLHARFSGHIVLEGFIIRHALQSSQPACALFSPNSGGGGPEPLRRQKFYLLARILAYSPKEADYNTERERIVRTYGSGPYRAYYLSISPEVPPLLTSISLSPSPDPPLPLPSPPSHAITASGRSGLHSSFLYSLYSLA